MIKRIINKELFFPGLLGVFINPFFFARRGLAYHIKKIGIQITGKTLDVGCGQKPYQSFFNSSEYIGLDIEVSGHNHKNSNVDIYYDGHKFPLHDLEFDSIVSNQVFEHVFHPSEFLSEINRVLKTNGILLLTVPFIWDEHEQPFDFARYTSFGIKHLLKEHKFEVIKSIKTVNNAGVIFQLINAYIYKIFKYNLFTKIVSLIFIAPFNLIGIIFSFTLPRNNDMYLDNIILAKKM